MQIIGKFCLSLSKRFNTVEQEEPKKKLKAYDYHFPMKSEIDLHKALVMQYSASQLALGKTPMLLDDKLTTLMAIYLKHGYTHDSKILALRTFGFGERPEDMKKLNAMNHKLKCFGYLIDDFMNKRVKNLNPDLALLKQYIDDVPGNQYVIRYMMFIDNGN